MRPTTLLPLLTLLLPTQTTATLLSFPFPFSFSLPTTPAPTRKWVHGAAKVLPRRRGLQALAEGAGYTEEAIVTRVCEVNAVDGLDGCRKEVKAWVKASVKGLCGDEIDGEDGSACAAFAYDVYAYCLTYGYSGLPSLLDCASTELAAAHTTPLDLLAVQKRAAQFDDASTSTSAAEATMTALNSGDDDTVADCGVQGGGVSCLSSETGPCCSVDGVCGATALQCGTGCQVLYGICQDAPPSPTGEVLSAAPLPTSTPDTSTATPTPSVVSIPYYMINGSIGYTVLPLPAPALSSSTPLYSNTSTPITSPSSMPNSNNATTTTTPAAASTSSNPPLITSSSSYDPYFGSRSGSLGATGGYTSTNATSTALSIKYSITAPAVVSSLVEGTIPTDVSVVGGGNETTTASEQMLSEGNRIGVYTTSGSVCTRFTMVYTMRL